MVYSWNAFKYPVDANIVGHEFEKLEEQEGELRPESIVAQATPKDSALHPLFEWNNRVAAEKYRITQAHQLIRALHVTYEENEAEPITVRAFTNISQERTGHFVHIDRAFQSAESREIVMQRALRELEMFQQKYKGMQELERLFVEIEALAQQQTA